MNDRMQWTLVLATITVFVTTAAFSAGLVCAGDLEPSAQPGATMHTLDEIYQKVAQIAGSVPIAKTGQTTSYAVGDDGDLEKGAVSPDPRFTDHEDGTVTDNLTGLMWTENANIYGHRNWVDALSDCASCTEGGYSDWRLPNVRELHSLIDYSRHHPALPADDPFSSIQSGYYWSSTTYAENNSEAWGVYVTRGRVEYVDKNNEDPVWCVRGGQ